MSKRLTLTERDAEHVYEWLIMYWSNYPWEPTGDRFGGCIECEIIGKRLEKFIGPQAVRRVARVVKQNPGDRGKLP